MSVYTLQAFDEDGRKVLDVELECGATDAENRFEATKRAAKRKGYFEVLLRNEFGTIRHHGR